MDLPDFLPSAGSSSNVGSSSDDASNTGRPAERLQLPPSITTVPGLVLTPLAGAATPSLDPFARWPRVHQQAPSDLPLDWRAREHLAALLKQATENAGVKRTAGGITSSALNVVDQEREPWEDVLVRMLAGPEQDSAGKGKEPRRTALLDLFDETTLRRLVRRNELLLHAERLVAQEERAEPKGKAKAKDAKKPAQDSVSARDVVAPTEAQKAKGDAYPGSEGTVKGEKARLLDEATTTRLRQLEHQRKVREKIRELVDGSAAKSVASDKADDASTATSAEASTSVWERPLKLVLHLKREETRHRSEPRDAWFSVGKWDGDDRLFDGAGNSHLLEGDGEGEDADEELSEKFGGTITIRGPSREVRKMLKVIELAVFAACNLKLEMHLLRDSSCPRLPPPPPDTPIIPAASPTLAADPSSPHFSPPLSPSPPKAIGEPADANEHGIPASRTSTMSGGPASPTRPPGSSGSGRAKWSRAGLWGLLLGRSEQASSSQETISPGPPSPRSPIDAPPASSTSEAPTIGKSQSSDHIGHRQRLRAKASELRKRFGTSRSRRRGYAQTDAWESLAGEKTVGQEAPSTEASEAESEEVTDGLASGRRDTKARAMKEALAVRPDALRPSHSDGGAPTTAHTDSGAASVLSTGSAATSLPGLASPRMDEPEPADRFERVIKRMEKALLSVSPDVVFPPPHLLVRLRQQEIVDSNDDNHPAHPMNGLRPGFDRQRSFATADAEALAHNFTSSHVFDPTHSASASYASMSGSPTASLSRATGEKKITVDARAGLASLMTNNSSLEGTMRHQSLQFLHERSSLYASPGAPTCEPPKWITLRYYDHRGDRDLHGTIGQVVGSLVDGKDDVCDAQGCGKQMGDHVMSLVHNTMKITVSVESGTRTTMAPREEGAAADTIMMWSRCKTCGQSSKPTIASDATLLVSFPKFLELILYGDAFVPSPEDLCEHADEHHDALIRLFAKDDTLVALTLQHVDLYELRLPTAIDASIGVDGKDVPPADAPHDGGDAEPHVQELSREISAFFESIKKRINSLEEAFVRIEDLGDLSSDHASAASSRASSVSRRGSTTEEEKRASNAVISRGRSKTIKATLADHQNLLYGMRSAFQADELELRSQLSTITSDTLNNLRKPFVDRVMSDKARLLAWEKKHLPALPEAERKQLGSPQLVEPTYAAPDVHALPADNSVLVREDELSSIIAFTLSSADYQRQLAVNKARTAGGTLRKAPQSLAAPAVEPLAKRDFSLPASLLFDGRDLPDVPSRKASPAPSPRVKPAANFRHIAADPDDGASFGEEAIYEAIAKPKKPLKHATSILSLRALGRQRSFDLSSFRPFGSLHGTPAKPPPTDSPEDKAEEGATKGGDTLKKGNDEKLLSDLIDGAENDKSKAISIPAVAPAPVAALLSRGPKAEASATLDVCATPHKPLLRNMSSTLSSRTPSKQRRASTPDNAIEDESFEILADDEVDHSFSTSRHASQQHQRSGSILSTLWGMGSQRIKAGDVPKDLGLDPDSSSPHIKYQFRHGDKEFTCTVWHAEQFAAIRQKCGISDQEFLIKSLSRCNTWDAVGGKSKAIFLKTSCDRFVLKQMVSAWNVSEREALLAFAPSYFSYLLSQTNQKPSLLCKIFGFFTVKIKDLAKDENIVKLDLLLTENLFHASLVNRKFDLKGISTRVAKVDPTTSESGRTGWDADWLEGSLRTLLLIHPHSKSVIASAIENDTAFLEETNTMDYSMLAGIDDHRRELIVGLIDVIGTFNLAKMIESRGKMALKSREKITILPPSDYAARFRRAMETYFVSVPEKWSRPTECPPEDQRWHENPTLPSVF